MPEYSLRTEVEIVASDSERAEKRATDALASANLVPSFIDSFCQAEGLEDTYTVPIHVRVAATTEEDAISRVKNALADIVSSQGEITAHLVSTATP